MEQHIKDELVNAIKSGRIEKKDTGAHPPGHSVPYFYQTSDGRDWCLLRARKDSRHLTAEQIAKGYERYKTLFPFLQKQNLGVKTPRECEVLTVDGEMYGVMDRFFGHGHSPDRFAKATKFQQDRFVDQMANFFFKVHSIPTDTLPDCRDFGKDGYNPYFKYDHSEPYNGGEPVFLHSDVNYSNFLVDDDYNLHAVFDWDAVCVGPRVAEFCTFVYCKDLPMLPRVLEKYNKLAGTSFKPEQVIAHQDFRKDGV